MSVYLKPFTTSDVIISPFEVNKSFVCHSEIPEIQFEVKNDKVVSVSNPGAATNFTQLPQASSTDDSSIAVNIDYNSTTKFFSLSSTLSESSITLDIVLEGLFAYTSSPMTLTGFIGEDDTSIATSLANSASIFSGSAGSQVQTTFNFPSVTLEQGKEYVFGAITSPLHGGRMDNMTASFSRPGVIDDCKIDRYIGQNIISPIWVSGSNSTGTVYTQDKKLVYESIKQLYYSNYLKGDNGSPASTASFNNDGTVTGPRYTPNYYNYLTTTLLADRFFPTGSNETIGVISIPSNLYGEYIKLNSVTLSTPNHTLRDDGNGNILSGSQKVGDIIYEHGIIVLTSDGIDPIGGDDGYGFITYGTGLYGITDETFINDFISNSNFTCSFESTTTIYESQYKCTLRQNEFNFTQNPTIISGSSLDSTLYDFATGSYFTPYVTTVGMYNNAQELIAVGKLAQPLPISQVTDTSILVNLDIH